MNIGTLTGAIELEDSFSGALKRTTSAVDQAVSSIDKSMKSLGANLTSVGTSMSKYITLPLVAAAAASLKFSGTFEQSMERLVSIAGVSSDELAGVRQHILDLAPAVGIGPQALADAMTKVSSTVSDTSTALEILDIAAKGTKAGFGETVDVAGALTSIINSYGAENITAARAADILAQAIKEGGAEAKDLAPVLSNVVPIASQLGISFEEVAANIATMTKLGTPTAEAVTSLTSVFTALMKETDQGKDALGDMNMSYAGLRQEIKEKGLAAALTSLSDKFKGNETAMVDVFGRIEAVKNIMGTAGVQGETLASVLDNIKKSSDEGGGAMQKMADAMSGTQIQTWKELSATVQTAAIAFGDGLAPSMSKVLGAAKPMLDFVLRMADGFAKLPPEIQTVAVGFGAFVAAAGPVILIAGKVVTSIAAINTAMGTAGLAGAVGVAGPLALAFAAGGLVIVKYLDLLDDLEAAQRTAMSGTAKQIDDTTKKARELAAKLGKPDIQDNWASVYIEPIKGIAKAATVAKPAIAALTDEQKEAAKAMQAAQKEITASMVPLTQQQKDQIKGWNEWNNSVDHMAGALGISSAAVSKYVKEMEAFDEGLARIAASQYQLGQAAVNVAKNVDGFTVKTSDAVIVNRDFSKALMEDQIQVDGYGHVLQRNLLPALGEVKIEFEHVATAGEELRDNLKNAFGRIPDIIKDAFTGGGGLIGAAKAIGVQFAEAFLAPFTARLSSFLSKYGGKLAGALTGGAVGAKSAVAGAGTSAAGTSALGGISLSAGLATAGIAAAAAGVYIGLKKLADQRKEMAGNRLRDDIFAADGRSLEAMNTQIMKATGSLQLMENLFKAKSTADVKDAYEAITSALAAYQERVDEAWAAHGELATRMQSVVDISPALEAALQTAYSASNPEQYLSAIKEINGVLDEQASKQSFLDDTLKKYGLSWVDTGAKARAAFVGGQAADMAKEFYALGDAGVDVNNIMRHMGDNISDLILDAKRSGTEVPESFKHIIQVAINSGEMFSLTTSELEELRAKAEELKQPFDAAQFKITDLSQTGVTFGTTMQTAADKISTSMDRLIEVLDRIGPASTAAANTTKIRFADANKTLDETEYHIDGIINGHSPSGLKDIPKAASSAGTAMENFGYKAVTSTSQAAKAVELFASKVSKIKAPKWSMEAKGEKLDLERDISLLSAGSDFERSKLQLKYDEQDAIKSLKDNKDVKGALPELLKLVARKYDLEMAQLVAEEAERVRTNPTGTTPGARTPVTSSQAVAPYGANTRSVGSLTIPVFVDGRELARAIVPSLTDEIARQTGRAA